MTGYGLLAGPLVALTAATACAQDNPKLPSSCAAAPSAECLVEAAIRAASPREAGALINGVKPLADHGRKDLARRLLLRADQMLSAADATQMESAADGWHSVGDDGAAEKDLERALKALTALAKPQPMPPRAALDYGYIAGHQADWGLIDQAKTTLTHMRADLPALSPAAATDIEVRTWSGAKRIDLAIAAAEADPATKDGLISNIFLGGCYPANELPVCLKAATKVDGAWSSAEVYTTLAAEAARDRIEEARQILETGVAAFAKAADDSRMTRGFNTDPVVLFARAWRDLDDPARALATLDIRATRPDLFPPALPLPIDDYVLRAELLARLGRTDEALKIAEEATANFKARPRNELERFRATFHAVAGGPQRSPFNRTLKEFNDGDRAYQAIIDTLVDTGKPDAIRTVVARFPLQVDPKIIDQAVTHAEFAAKRQSDTLATPGLPAKKPVGVTIASGPLHRDTMMTPQARANALASAETELTVGNWIGAILAVAAGS